MNRRHFIKASAACLAAAVGAQHAFGGGSAASTCRPKISGTLWGVTPEGRAWGRAGWEKELAVQRAVGFDLLWLVQSPALLDGEGFNLRDLLDVCAEHGFGVIVDTGCSDRWYAPFDLAGELARCRENIKTIGRRLAGHPAFFAWYVPHEIYMTWGEGDRYIRELYPALNEACRRAAELPVTVSPFFILDRTKVFGDFRYNEPEEYRRFWAELIKRSGFNIVMLQDSGEHFSYVTLEQRRPFFEAMAGACKDGGARFWGNVEVAEMECGSIEEYVQRYGRVHHSAAKGIPWRAVPLERLRGKLELAAEYAERIVSWGYREFCRPALGKAAETWYEAYRAYLRQLK